MRLDHQSRASVVCAALLCLTVLAPCASAAAESVVAAVNAHDIAALEGMAKLAQTPQQRALAAGSLLAMRREDAQGIAILMPVTRSTANRILRATAYRLLGYLYYRDARYRACYSAFHSGSQLSSQSLDPNDRQDMAQCQTLEGVKPMRLVRDTPGSLPVTRDSLDLMRVPVKIDGDTHEAIVDTGAGLSVISVSAAKRAGIRMLNSQGLSTGTASERALAVRLGIARRLQIGNAMLTNVVFLVLPDAALRLPHDRINAIIGVPVLMALGPRLEFVNSAKSALLYDVANGNSAGAAGSDSHLIFYEDILMILVQIPGVRKPLGMFLDTGTTSSELAHGAIVDAPALLRHAERHALPLVGAGGTVKEVHGLILPDVTLIIGGRRFKLKKVPVNSATSAISSYGADGNIGQDILRQGAGWIVNFKTMTLAVAK